MLGLLQRIVCGGFGSNAVTRDSRIVVMSYGAFLLIGNKAQCTLIAHDERPPPDQILRDAPEEEGGVGAPELSEVNMREEAELANYGSLLLPRDRHDPHYLFERRYRTGAFPETPSADAGRDSSSQEEARVCQKEHSQLLSGRSTVTFTAAGR
uniref:Uncharacterized protein n=1 Tax=Steinernema glaseri TaxID=37863 RepID=A0A1I7ZV74_9BILA